MYIKQILHLNQIYQIRSSTTLPSNSGIYTIDYELLIWPSVWGDPKHQQQQRMVPEVEERSASGGVFVVA
uniref:Uncharacterized protein n=1 Tax=Panagrolaimus sp. ES5 TaxID=591445 RepID=A0AC34FVW0_9BILA